MDLTDEQWALVASLIIRPPRRADGKGRPRQADRPLLDGMLWIWRTGLPDRYPPYQRVHCRLQEWVGNGTFERILTSVADDLLERGQLDLSECFMDGTFVVAKQGAPAWERPSGVKVRRSWPLPTALLFLSPSMLPLLRHMQSPLVKRLSKQAWLTSSPSI